MTRGRRKDLTIPPSRALLQQRDYRARKAQYVADLEDRVRKAEEENAKLKKEIDGLRMRAAASGTMGPSPEVVSPSLRSLLVCIDINKRMLTRSRRWPHPPS